MNHNPLHVDEHYMRDHQHGRILVVGTYVFSLVVGMSVGDTSGKAVANLEYERVTHDAPVFQGDTIYAESEVLETRQSRSRPDRGNRLHREPRRQPERREGADAATPLPGAQTSGLAGARRNRLSWLRAVRRDGGPQTRAEQMPVDNVASTYTVSIHYDRRAVPPGHRGLDRARPDARPAGDRLRG